MGNFPAFLKGFKGIHNVAGPPSQRSKRQCIWFGVSLDAKDLFQALDLPVTDKSWLCTSQHLGKREIFTFQFLLLKNGNDIMYGMWISNPYFRFPNFLQKWAVSGSPLIITVSPETLLTSVGLLFPPSPVFSAALCKLTISKVKMPGIALFSELLAVLGFCLLVCRTKGSTSDSG